MPDSTDTQTIPEHVQPTFGPPRVVARKPRTDTTLAEAIETARVAVEEFVSQHEIGEHLGVTADDERLVTHRFVSHVPGYGGWELFATLARAPRSKVVTVCETGMLPGKDAILAPDWVPWMERASEEERIRLDAIAAGEDPAKALEAAGYGASQDDVAKDEAQQEAADEDEQRKQARRAAKRRRAKHKAARKKQKKTKQDASAQKVEKQR